MNPLERHRKAVGLTQAQLGERVGVSMRQVWNWENGKSTPHPALYPKLAEILGVTALEVTELIVPSTPVGAA